MKLWLCRSLFVVWTVSFLTGCFSLPRVEFPSDALPLANSEARCETLTSPDQELQSLRALLDVTLRYGDEVGSLRYAVIARQPDSFRVDLLPDSGAFTLGMLVTNAGVTTILDAQEKSFIRGRDEAALIDTFLRIPGFSRDVVIGIVSGVLPKQLCDRVTIRTRPNGEYLIEDNARSVVWHFDSLTRTVSGVTGVTGEGSLMRYYAERSNYEGDLPSISLRLYDPVEATVRMDVRKLVINPKLGDQLFRVTIPGGYQDRS